MASNNPNVAGKRHTALMQAHYARLQSFSNDAMAWIDQIEAAHRDFYPVLLRELEESSRPEDFATYEHLDIQYVKMLSSLQAARERIVEAGCHVKRALVHPGDNLAHLKNVTPETFK